MSTRSDSRHTAAALPLLSRRTIGRAVLVALVGATLLPAADAGAAT